MKILLVLGKFNRWSGISRYVVELAERFLKRIRLLMTDHVLSGLSRKYRMLLQMPMIEHKEIKVILQLLKKIKPKVCLEWGQETAHVIFPDI